MVRILLLCSVVVLLLAGCATHEGCKSACYERALERYAGDGAVNFQNAQEILSARFTACRIRCTWNPHAGEINDD